MSKEIWLGPVLGTNRARLLARCAEYVADGKNDRLLYIAASHPLLDLATGRILNGQNCRGVWGEFPFYLFRGFVRRVLSTTRLAPRVPIDREELPLRLSLVSQIIKQLADAGKLPAIKRLANRDGCINTIASLIGELQRAGKTAEEFATIVKARIDDFEIQSPHAKVHSSKSQTDFDGDVALVYSKYSDALNQFGLTDDDADQLRALQILRGELDDESSANSWLDNLDLLVLDGFFDFTPVQGEMLRQMIPRIPNVIVNLNYDHENEQIFQPFQSTIEQLKSIADFKEITNVDSAASDLRGRLFNTDVIAEANSSNNVRYALFECADREVEVRAIAKEIKRLIVQEDYQLKDVALVVRERAAYAETILRVCSAESIPCNLERRVSASEIPCVRACLKLFQVLKDSEREHVTNPKASDLAHLIKTDYFRFSVDNLKQLSENFDSKYAALLGPDESKLRGPLGIGEWSPDKIENVIAYVGSELRARSWLERAQRLIRVLPSTEAAASFMGVSEADDAALNTEADAPAEENLPAEKPKRPSPVHPAAIAWAMLVIEHLRETISKVPEVAAPNELRTSLMLLLDALEFSSQVKYPLARKRASMDTPQAALDVRGMESLRRALAATVRSFGFARQTVSKARAEQTSLASFIDELERCLKSQMLAVSAGDRDGLRVLEATDIRGLRFRAIFIAGLIEGSFPLRMSRDWLYPHEERERLKKDGVVLEDISTETLLKEEHYFYQSACRALERLYLTRPLAADDGIETVPSYYIEELKRAIAPAELEAKQIRGDINTRELSETSNARELAVALVAQKCRLPRLNQLLPQTVAEELTLKARDHGFVSESLLRRVAIELQRSSDTFGPNDGQITQSELQELLNRHFGADYVYSASGLSAFGNCPYKFFAARVLRLQPRNEAALDLPAIDAGKLLHDVLRRFFTRHRKEYLPDLDRKELRDEIAAVADEVFTEHERLVPALNDRIWKIDCEIRKLVLDQVLLYELRLQERTCGQQMQPTFFELAFGRTSDGSDPDSKSDYLVLSRAGANEHALVQGQIDRVDVSADGRYAVAYDYKLSQGARIRDMEAGRQIQIPIYLAALEKLFLPSAELAGGGYYRLRGRGARLNQGIYRKMFESCTDVTTHHAKVDDAEWQRIRATVAARVWQFIDAMRRGDFRVKPSLGRATCKFCDYSAVCRYDTYRIGRKN